MSKNKPIYCQIHSEEPCGSTCNEHCDDAAHFKHAVERNEKRGWICEECAEDINQSAYAEQHYQAGYAYACGYYD